MDMCGRIAGWIIAAVASASAAAAEPLMTFQVIGSLTENTAQVSLTTTPSGRVVIGEAYQAEAFDTATGTWLPAIPFHGGHWMAGAAAIADGRVLIAGTTTPTAGAVSAEVIDPLAGTASPAGAMATPRYADYLGAMPDGRVFVWAGTRPGTSGPPIATAETYVPATDAFTPAGSALPARYSASFTRLSDGRFLVVGGSDTNGNAQLVAQLYDPMTNTASNTGAMPDFLIQHAAVLLNDGRVLIVGGSYSLNGSWVLSNRAYVYSPANGHFTRIASMSNERKLPTATLLPDGSVLVAGGTAGLYETPVAAAEIFNPATNAFSVGPSMVSPRYGASAVALTGGRVLIAGGSTGPSQGNQPVASVEVFGSDRIFEGSFE
jgi:hypothetical protein